MTAQSTSRLPLPQNWVSEIFRRMHGRYGSLWLDRWRSGEVINGTDAGVQSAMAQWAEDLAGFAECPEAIKRALESCKTLDLPPTLPEFAKLCREAMRRVADEKPKLGYTQTKEERQRAKDASEKIAGATKHAEGYHDFLKWATHPRSKIAVQTVFNEAKSGNKALAKVFDDLVTAGVVTPEGKALKLYINGEWTKCK